MFQLKLIQIFVLLSSFNLVALTLDREVKSAQRGPALPWSGRIQANQAQSELPAKYFLCGFAFRVNPWTVNLKNCCRRILFWRKCRFCPNTFKTMTSGFKGIFCHNSDWNNKVVKTFQTKNQAWRDDVMCPPGYYASGFAAQFGHQHGVDLGFNNLFLRCSTITMSQHVVVQNNFFSLFQTFITAQFGNFISNIRLKYQPGGQLWGIHAGFQPKPIISAVQITYDAFAPPNVAPTVLEIQTVKNFGRKKAQKRAQFKNNFQVKYNFILNNGNLYGYEISNSIRFKLPEANSPSSAVTFRKYYQQVWDNFGREATATALAQDNVLVFVPPCTQTKISSIVNLQDRNIPFTATITFSSLFNGQFLLRRTERGTWSGTLSSGVTTIIKQQALSNCSNIRPDD